MRYSMLFALASFALLAGCSSNPTCSPSTCNGGCCDPAGVCQPGYNITACGNLGLACSVCSGGLVCTAGQCLPAGNGGGTGMGGGSGGGTGGGTGGGSGGGTGGGLGGGSGGGSGGGTGGGAALASTFPDWGMGSSNGKEPQVAVDASGKIHFAYNGFTGTGTPTVYPVRYGECSANCTNTANWSFITVDDEGSLGGYAHMVLDANGHPRILFYHQTDFTNPSQWRFASCDNGCASSAANWTVGVAHTMANASVYSDNRHNFTVDALGHAHFIYPSYENFANITTYVTCAGNCAAGESNWSSVVIDPNNQDVSSIATTASGGVRATFTRSNPPVISYRECDTGCDNAANWSTDQSIFWSLDGENVIRLNAQGQPRIAWFQGNTQQPNAASTDNQLLYGYCNGNCTDPSQWYAATLGLGTDDGKDGFDMVLDPAGTPAFAYRAMAGASSLGLSVCNSNCNTPQATWGTAAQLETGDEASAQVTPPLPYCDPNSTSPNPFGSWYTGFEPAIALYGSAGLAIGHRTEEYQQCLPGGPVVVESISLVRIHIVQ